MRDFRNYDVWVDAVDYSVFVYEMTNEFPKKETYALCDQLQRASVSVPSNIAEGCSRRSANEFAHYLEISLGSCYEVDQITWEKVGMRIRHLYEKTIQKYYGQ